MDDSLRSLERRYLGSGDPEILEKLEIARQRANLCLGCGTIPPEDFTRCHKCQPLCVIWDSAEQVKYQAEFLQTEDSTLTEEEAYAQAYTYDYQHESDWMAAEIGGWIEALNPFDADWFELSSEETTDWSPTIPHLTGTEAHQRELGYEFIRAMSLDNSDNHTICYDGESLRVKVPYNWGIKDDVYVPAVTCEICEDPHATEKAAETCCYLCEICEDPHKTPEAAKNCCFVCPHCETVTAWGTTYPTSYKTREEMEDCCHLCLGCESTWDTAEEALNCCT